MSRCGAESTQGVQIIEMMTLARDPRDQEVSTALCMPLDAGGWKAHGWHVLFVDWLGGYVKYSKIAGITFIYHT